MPAGSSRSTTRYLALRWVDEGLLDEEALGRDLAALHAAGAPGFGSTPHGGRCASAPRELPAGEGEDWATFYARWRIAPLADQALERGALSREGRAADRARVRADGRPGRAARGPGAPARRPLGGQRDGRHGRPRRCSSTRRPTAATARSTWRCCGCSARISPTTLAAYEERAPLAEGHADRVQLYQLLPLLVHAVLFGGSYGASAAQAARRYAGG